MLITDLATINPLVRVACSVLHMVTDVRVADTAITMAILILLIVVLGYMEDTAAAVIGEAMVVVMDTAVDTVAGSLRF